MYVMGRGCSLGGVKLYWWKGGSGEEIGEKGSFKGGKSESRLERRYCPERCHGNDERADLATLQISNPRHLHTSGTFVNNNRGNSSLLLMF